MFEIMQESEGNVIGVHMAGTVQKQDYAELVPKVEILAKQCDDIRVLWDLVTPPTPTAPRFGARSATR